MEKKEKTYCDLLNEFWQGLDQHPMKVTAIALYCYLLHRWNRLHKENPFCLPNETICSVLRVDPKTLDRARRTLVSDGLIEYRRGGRGRMQGVYGITALAHSLRRENLPPDDTEAETSALPLSAHTGDADGKKCLFLETFSKCFDTDRALAAVGVNRDTLEGWYSGDPNFNMAMVRMYEERNARRRSGKGRRAARNDRDGH